MTENAVIMLSFVPSIIETASVSEEGYWSKITECT